jgi:uncharacterized protein (DUF1330 family)
MKQTFKFAMAIVAGVAMGGAVVEGIHAQAKKTPVYVVTEIEVSNLEAYMKEYAPTAQANIKKAGGKLIAATQSVTSIEGAPPSKRVSIQHWDSLDAYQGFRKMNTENRKIGDKYAKFRTYSVEAVVLTK